MPSPHEQIADAARDAWDRSHALLVAARVGGMERVDIAIIADYADEQRDRWLRACDRTRPDPYEVLAALDYGADDDDDAVDA